MMPHLLSARDLKLLPHLTSLERVSSNQHFTPLLFIYFAFPLPGSFIDSNTEYHMYIILGIKEYKCLLKRKCVHGTEENGTTSGLQVSHVHPVIVTNCRPSP
jgi:hypothetical protein